MSSSERSESIFISFVINSVSSESLLLFSFLGLVLVFAVDEEHEDFVDVSTCFVDNSDALSESPVFCFFFQIKVDLKSYWKNKYKIIENG